MHSLSLSSFLFAHGAVFAQCYPTGLLSWTSARLMWTSLGGFSRLLLKAFSAELRAVLFLLLISGNWHGCLGTVSLGLLSSLPLGTCDQPVLAGKSMYNSPPPPRLKLSVIL